MRTIIGLVTSDKSDKTIVVSVHSRKTHPIYKKQYSRTQKIMAHDEKNEAKVGDKVEIVESRPLSARKRFILKRVIETAKILHVEAEVVPEKIVKEDKPVVKKTKKTEEEVKQ